MISIVRDCCEAMLALSDDFWLVAILTGWSFETGGSKKFRRAVRSFSDAGLPAETTARLQKGVNGNFVELIKRLAPVSQKVRGNRRHQTRARPDFRFGAEGTSEEVVGEIKAVYDLTKPAFYGHKDRHGVADDQDKLLKLRTGGFRGKLYQVVFFAQLPRFECPKGCWYPPAWKQSDCKWSDYPGVRGIDAQYRYLRTQITLPPIGEPNSLVVRRLDSPSKTAADAMSKRFATVFRPDGDWHFDPGAHLAQSAAGYAIWSY